MLCNKKGFTVIELMIVLAIMGIIAAIVIPQFKEYTQKKAAVELVVSETPSDTP